MATHNVANHHYDPPFVVTFWALWVKGGTSALRFLGSVSLNCLNRPQAGKGLFVGVEIVGNSASPCHHHHSWMGDGRSVPGHLGSCILTSANSGR